MSFNNLNLSPWLLKLCSKIQYNSPTPIQAMAIPSIMRGESVIANAQTGSGKTAAFAFPILDRLAKDPFSIYAVVIAPSRELAIQIHTQLSIFGQTINLRQSLIIGGVSYNKQIQQIMSYPHIVVATPGRLCEMIDRCIEVKQQLKRVQVLVLDEADRLFEPTMLPNIQAILLSLTNLKQCILATATIDENFQAKKLKSLLPLKMDFKKFSTFQERKTVKTLSQKYIFTPQQLKPGYLMQCLSSNQNMKIIIFVKTCKQCTLMAETLKQLEYSAVALHSFMRNTERLASLGMFRNDVASILVTTDLTSRGLDIPNVTMVINYHLPRTLSDYIHRVGRTARNGFQGQAISFITQYQVELFLNIEEQVGVKMQQEKFKENLEEVSRYNKKKRQVKIKLMSLGILADLEKRRVKKLQYKNQMKHKSQLSVSL